jgi:DUF971 family protein
VFDLQEEISYNIIGFNEKANFFAEGMIPVDMKKSDARTLQIEWDDGHISRYPLEFLRRECPCASCGEARRAPAKPANPLRVLQPHEMIQSNLDIRQAEVVGRYAIQFQWNDGHAEGIFTFDFLRGICQCESCAKKPVI